MKFIATVIAFIFVYIDIGSAASISESNDAPFFRKDYVYSKEMNAFYKVSKLIKSWSEAVETCSFEGAQLLIPQSKAEIDAVFEIIQDNIPLWIGIHDIFSENTFVTLDGKPLKDAYVEWGPGEPNNVNFLENCLVTNKEGITNDDYCNNKFKFVCKKPNVNLQHNFRCETYDPAYVYVADPLDRCYKFHTIPMSWSKAFKMCKAEEATLAVINNQIEANYFVDIFSKHPEYSLSGNFEKNLIHIGFNDLISNGVYITSDGKTLSEAGYENWAPGQPDNANNNEHCGSMLRDGSLNDVVCQNRAMFICEKILTDLSLFARMGDQ